MIVKKLDRALGATPAALLAGNNALETNFDLSDGGKRRRTSNSSRRSRKSADTASISIRIGFKDNLPRTMELHDSFGQVTQLTFDTFERNPSLDPALVPVLPPPGADVVGELTLFTVANPATPLAERLRPKTIGEVIGQRHLLGSGQAAGGRLRDRASRIR